MRSVIAVGFLLAGCAHKAPPIDYPRLEVALDEGRASERPLMPDKTFEMLIRFDPKLLSYRPHEMRFLVAQPGRVVFTVYGVTADGQPGAPLKTIDRNYGPEWISSATDGRWVLENLADIPVQHGPIFVGLYSPEKHADPRLWASSNPTNNVFQREVEGGGAPAMSAVPRTPKLRIVVAPE